MEKNDEQHAISMEFNASSGFEIEPQESEALAYYDSQHRIELLPCALLDNESVLKDSAKTNLPQVFLGF